MFGEKLAVLRARGLAALASAHDLTEDDLANELSEICALRNAIGHYDEEDERLSDPTWPFTRMRIARRYAERAAAHRL